jgi:citrate synthase
LLSQSSDKPERIAQRHLDHKTQRRIVGFGHFCV